MDRDERQNGERRASGEADAAFREFFWRVVEVGKRARAERERSGDVSGGEIEGEPVARERYQ